jgi:hypothetical protein
MGRGEHPLSTKGRGASFREKTLQVYGVSSSALVRSDVKKNPRMDQKKKKEKKNKSVEE